MEYRNPQAIKILEASVRALSQWKFPTSRLSRFIFNKRRKVQNNN